MNHPYPDSYHGGYIRGPPGMQGMGFSQGGYDNSANMMRMGHPRNSYPMGHYPEGGQMHPMMHQQSGAQGMYPHSGYMGGGGHHYPPGNYPGYSMSGMSHGGMNLGPRGHYNNAMRNYYNHPSQQLPVSSMGNHQPQHMTSPQHSSQLTSSHNPQHAPQVGNHHTTQISNHQPPTSTISTHKTHNSHMNTQHHHGTTMSNHTSSTIGYGKQETNPASMQPTSYSQQSHLSPIPRHHSGVTTSPPTLHTISPASQVPSYPGQVPSPHNTNNSIVSYNSSNCVASASQSPSSQVASPMGSGGSSVPQHPMRNQASQQSPQEVADSILQIASSYPVNATVQVPLKGRHAPYHIPRSPHYNTSSETTHASSSSSISFQQHSPAPLTSPSPSSGVKSPTLGLAPIPNPIPSPGISDVKSPLNTHCLSPLGSHHSPAHMSASFSGHNQPAQSPQHYSPSRPHLSSYVHSPPPLSSGGNLYYSSSNGQVSFPQSENQSYVTNYSKAYHSSSPQTSSILSAHGNMSSVHSNQGSGGGGNNNPLQSLQKLVMLPETQVVDPKSVVNDACLAAVNATQNEIVTDSKNCENPAEGVVESTVPFVGCSGQLSSQVSQFQSDTVPQDIMSMSTIQSSEEMTGKSDAMSQQTDISIIQSQAEDRNGKEYVVESDSSTQDFVKQGNENLCLSYNCDKSEVPTMGTESSVMSGSEPNQTSSNDLNALKESNDVIGDSTQVDDMDTVLKLCTEMESNTQVVQSKDVDKKEVDKIAKTEDVTEKSVVLEGTGTIDTEILNIGEKKENGNQEISFDDVSCEERDLVKEENKTKDIAASHSCENPMNLPPDSLLNVNLKPPCVDLVDNPTKQSESAQTFADVKKEFPNIKMEDSQCELNQMSLEDKASNVLSEVQVVPNKNDTPILEGDKEDGNGKINRQRLRNELKSVMKSKLHKAKKVSPFLRLTTPCSIAVGADEREVCEQFAYRRNGYCHALQTSRMFYNGRHRYDSNSLGDSDESVENISETSFHTLSNPQDGSKKRNVGKKGDSNSKQSNSGSTKTSTSKEMVRKSTNGSATNISTCQSSQNDCDLVEDESKGVSDEEMTYYEGVDSSDFMTVNNSSDDSVTSSPDTKQKNNTLSSIVEANPECSGVTSKDKSDMDVSEMSSSCPVVSPAKRSRRSLALKKERKIREDDFFINSNVTESVTNGHSAKGSLNSLNGNNSTPSHPQNGKIAVTKLKKRKSALRNSQTNGKNKLSEVLVKLEKKELLENSMQGNDIVDLTDSTGREETTQDSMNIVLDDGEIIKVEKNIESDCSSQVKSENKEVIQKSETANNTTPGKATNATPKKRKRQAKKKPQPVPVKGKDEELRESFKSMKFSRTLDMMKSQRKKEPNFTGPFIRLTGNRAAPNNVSLFNQISQTPGPSGSKQGSKTNQKLLNKGLPAGASTIHMVSNLPSDKDALVSSTKLVSQERWVCVFCHQSSHRTLGDLFGPYYKAEDLPRVELLAAEEVKKAKTMPSTEEAKKGKAASTPRDKGKGPSVLKKKKSSLSPKKDVGPPEVWVHECCALWAHGVYVIGSKLYGLDEAVRDVAECICSCCKEKGAMVGCLHKGCAMKYHIGCAIQQGCCLDEEKLSLLCPKHKERKPQTPAFSNLPFS